MISVTDNPNPVTGGSLTYRSAAQFNNSWNWNIHYRAAASYITGSHNFKVGFNNAYLHHENTTYTDPGAPYSYNFANGVPTHDQLSHRAAHDRRSNVDYDFGLFAQDRWTVGRWTLQGGVRFDAFANSYPEQAIAPTLLRRTLNVRFDKIDNLKWKDITPKMGATYDLFGTGRTALKVTLNKYLEGMGTTGAGGVPNVSNSPNPINRLNAQTSRPWTDNGANGGIAGDFTPQCNLQDYAANGECGALLNAGTFGNLNARHQLRSRPDAGLGQALLQLGVHARRAARADAARVAQRPVRPPVVRELPGLSTTGRSRRRTTIGSR